MSTPSTPENTSTRDPLVHLAGMSGGSSYVEEMERAGQQEVVASETMPTASPWPTLERLGFTRGEQVPGDPLFTHCTLPQGWTRAASEHAMASYVLDERGVRRVEVFYKAAYYDRKASAYVMAPGVTVASAAIYGSDDVVLPEVWDRLTEDEREDFVEVLREYSRNAAEHPDIYASRLPRVQALLELVGGGPA